MNTQPHINERGELRIPLNADPKYFWWKGGQTVVMTLAELSATPATWKLYAEENVALNRDGKCAVCGKDLQHAAHGILFCGACSHFTIDRAGVSALEVCNGN